jgi:uncharacterized protein
MSEIPKIPVPEVPAMAASPATAPVERPLERPLERIDPRLLELLVCPVTKKTLTYDAAKQELISKAARLAFPINKGVALLTVDAARELED